MKFKAVASMIVVVLILTTTVTHAEEQSGKKEIKPALLLIDVQNEWMPRMSEEDRGSAPEIINEAIALFREFGYPVILSATTLPTRM